MMSPLRPVDVRPQTLLLLPQGLLLLSPAALTAHDHHDRLVPCLFVVRRAARRQTSFRLLFCEPNFSRPSRPRVIDAMCSS